MSLRPSELDVVFVPVGGGGLVSGVAAVLKAASPGIRVVGCQPEASDVMARSVAAGRVVEVEWRETLSDGTAGELAWCVVGRLGREWPFVTGGGCGSAEVGEGLCGVCTAMHQLPAASPAARPVTTPAATPALLRPTRVAGGIEPDSVTLEPCRQFVDEWVTVGETDIARAMVEMYSHHGTPIEGG